MMDGFSPLSRRIIAVGLLVLALLSLASFIIQPWIGITMASLERLADARFQLMRLQTIEAAPPAPPGVAVPANMLVHAPSREKGAAQLLAMVDALAGRSGVIIEAASPIAADPRAAQLTLDMVVAGNETALLGFVRDLEASRPLLRFATWRIAAPDAANAPTRLEARVMAVWEKAP